MSGKTFERLVVPIFYILFLATVCALAGRVLGLKEGLMFSLIALAWFVFGRLLVMVYLCAISHLMTRSHQPAVLLSVLLSSVIVDGLGVLVTLRVDPDLIWSALSAIVLSEGALWSLDVANLRLLSR